MDYKIKSFRSSKTTEHCVKCKAEMGNTTGLIRTWAEDKELKSGTIKQVKKSDVVCLKCLFNGFTQHEQSTFGSRLKGLFRLKRAA